MTSKAWFDIDKDGLAKILERRGKQFAIAELISNAWDQDVTEVVVKLRPAEGRTAFLSVSDDDPNGFKDLTHAYTMFAESEKKDKADKRGRFNLGEKLVLAICTEATILSTTGGVRFDDKGRHQLRQKRGFGSEFSGTIKMTKAEIEQCAEFVRTLIPPAGIKTIFNGEELQQRQPKAEFEMFLETHIADDEGMLKKTTRKTTVRVYEPLVGETPSLYELGIPVVETNDKWHIDIGQKVPLSLERDNVPPAYLRKLRAEVMNHLFQHVQGDEAATTWVKAATEAPEARPEAVEHVLTQQFGPKRVIYDPSDPEANKRAVVEGYTVISPRSLSAGQWDHVREHRLALPAGQVTPSPKAVFAATDGTDPDKSKIMPEEKYTEGMRFVKGYALALAVRLGIGHIKVEFLNDITSPFLACYGSKRLMFNIGKLGYRWFDSGITAQVDELIIHEFGHDYAGDHLSEEFHDALCKIGAKMKRIAIESPEFFKQYEREGAVR